MGFHNGYSTPGSGLPSRQVQSINTVRKLTRTASNVTSESENKGGSKNRVSGDARVLVDVLTRQEW